MLRKQGRKLWDEGSLAEGLDVPAGEGRDCVEAFRACVGRIVSAVFDASSSRACSMSIDDG